MIYVGSIVIAPPAGYLYQRIGFEHTYLIMGGIALFFTLVSAFTLSACQSRRDGTPAPEKSPDELTELTPAKH